MARDRNGYQVLASHHSAVCFCTLGAINAVMYGNLHKYDRLDLRDAALALLYATPDGNLTVAQYNDLESTTHDDIMKVFDDAIRATDADEYPFQAGDGVDSGSLGA